MQNKNKKIILTVIAFIIVIITVCIIYNKASQNKEIHNIDEHEHEESFETHEVHNNDNYLNIPVADSNRELAEIICSVQGEEYAKFTPVVSDKQETYESTVSALGININDTMACAMSVDSSENSAYAISIFKVEEDKMQTVVECLNSYVVNKKEQVKDNEEAKAIADSAIVTTQDDYVSIIMCKNSEEVKNKILEGLKESNDKINESMGTLVGEVSEEHSDEASDKNEHSTESIEDTTAENEASDGNVQEH